MIIYKTKIKDLAPLIQDFEDGDYDFITATELSSDVNEGIYYLQQYYPANTYPKGTIVVIEDEGGSNWYYYYEAQ